MSTNTGRYTVTKDTKIGPDVDLDAEHLTDVTGEPITEASTEAYTEQRSATRERGRPSLGSKGSSPSIAFRIPPELREQAEAIAAREGRTISAIAREQLEHYVLTHSSASHDQESYEDSTGTRSTAKAGEYFSSNVKGGRYKAAKGSGTRRAARRHLST